jgi:serine protease Do
MKVSIFALFFSLNMKFFNNMKTRFFQNRGLAQMVFAGLLGGALSLLGFFYWLPSYLKKNTSVDMPNASSQLARYAALSTQPAFDFTGVAEIANPAVVHIKTTSGGNSRQQDPRSIDPFDFFNGPGFRFDSPGPRMAAGSGVIISEDGYIVTNNHVVADANKIEVVLNDKRSYIAELVGTDKNTDLAVLRISDNELPFLKLGNSDEVKVGQWVVAVGNPFNLNSTVTLGIVSALGRNIDLLRSQGNQYAIENFIQTDAAINPGNSGGALVNVAGELIGINTAIASQTGSYAGYGFAVPVNLTKKVVSDIMKYGKVQRAILGVSIQEVTQSLVEEKNLPNLKGVFIADVVNGGAADKAGIKKGDVILKIDGEEVNSSSALQEKVGKYRPGDKIAISVRRSGSVKEIHAVLLGKDGETKITAATPSNAKSYLGMSLSNTSKEERDKFKIKSGVKVETVESGVFAQAGIPKGFIITHINNDRVYSPQGAISILNGLTGAIVIEGKLKTGEDKIFAVRLPQKQSPSEE